jgi:hypothetical protein
MCLGTRHVLCFDLSSLFVCKAPVVGGDALTVGHDLNIRLREVG